jgi:hypothetical protein
MRRAFGEFEYVEDAFIRHSPGRSRRLAPLLTVFPPLRWLYRFMHTRIILARKPAASAVAQRRPPAREVA